MDEPLILRLYLPKHLSEKLKNAFRAENSIVFLCIAMNKLKVFSKLCSSVLSAYANALGLQNMLCFDKVLNGCKTGFQLKAICNKTRILENFLVFLLSIKTVDSDCCRNLRPQRECTFRRWLCIGKRLRARKLPVVCNSISLWSQQVCWVLSGRSLIKQRSILSGGIRIWI